MAASMPAISPLSLLGPPPVLRPKSRLKSREVNPTHFSSGVKRNENDQSRLVVRFLDGQNLLASDVETGKSDPIGFIWCGSIGEKLPLLDSLDSLPLLTSKTYMNNYNNSGNVTTSGTVGGGIMKTKVCPCTVDPIWNEDVIVPIGKFLSSATANNNLGMFSGMRLIVLVRDEDLDSDGVTINYDELGMIQLPFKDIVTKGKIMKSDNSIVTPPTKYTLKKSPGMRRVEGSIRLTISLIISDEDLVSLTKLLAGDVSLNIDGMAPAAAGDNVSVLETLQTLQKVVSSSSSSAAQRVAVKESPATTDSSRQQSEQDDVNHNNNIPPQTVAEVFAIKDDDTEDTEELLHRPTLGRTRSYSEINKKRRKSQQKMLQLATTTAAAATAAIKVTPSYTDNTNSYNGNDKLSDTFNESDLKLIDNSFNGSFNNNKNNNNINSNNYHDEGEADGRLKCNYSNNNSNNQEKPSAFVSPAVSSSSSSSASKKKKLPRKQVSKDHWTVQSAHRGVNPTAAAVDANNNSGNSNIAGGNGNEIVNNYLSVRFLEGQNLLAADVMTGKSDPVCFVWWGRINDTPPPLDAFHQRNNDYNIKRTEACTSTCNPLWNRSKDVDLVFPLHGALSTSNLATNNNNNNTNSDIYEILKTKIIIYVRDQDTLEDGSIYYDELGMLEINVKDVILEGKILQNSIMKSACWYDLKKTPGMIRIDGKLKLALTLFFDDNDYDNLKSQIDPTDCSSIRINDNKRLMKLLSVFQNQCKSGSGGLTKDDKNAHPSTQKNRQLQSRGASRASMLTPPPVVINPNAMAVGDGGLAVDKSATPSTSSIQQQPQQQQRNRDFDNNHTATSSVPSHSNGYQNGNSNMLEDMLEDSLNASELMLHSQSSPEMTTSNPHQSPSSIDNHRTHVQPPSNSHERSELTSLEHTIQHNTINTNNNLKPNTAIINQSLPRSTQDTTQGGHTQLLNEMNMSSSGMPSEIAGYPSAQGSIADVVRALKNFVVHKNALQQSLDNMARVTGASSLNLTDRLDQVEQMVKNKISSDLNNVNGASSVLIDNENISVVRGDSDDSSHINVFQLSNDITDTSRVNPSAFVTSNLKMSESHGNKNDSKNSGIETHINAEETYAGTTPTDDMENIKLTGIVGSTGELQEGKRPQQQEAVASARGRGGDSSEEDKHSLGYRTRDMTQNENYDINANRQQDDDDDSRKSEAFHHQAQDPAQEMV